MEWINLNPRSPRPVLQARGDWGVLNIMPPIGGLDPVSRVSFAPTNMGHVDDLGQVTADLWLLIHGCERLVQPLPMPTTSIEEQLAAAGFTLDMALDDKRLYRKDWGKRGFFQLVVDSTHLSLAFEKRHNACAYTLGNFIWREGEHAVAWPPGEPVQLALRWALMLVEQWNPEQVFGRR